MTRRSDMPGSRYKRNKSAPHTSYPHRQQSHPNGPTFPTRNLNGHRSGLRLKSGNLQLERVELSDELGPTVGTEQARQERPSSQEMPRTAEYSTPTGIPDTAEELWPGKKHSDRTLVQFFEDVWGRYIKIGLTLGHLKTRDRKLWKAIYNYRSTEGVEWPIKLPNERTKLSEIMHRLSVEGVQALTAKELVAVGRKLERDNLRPPQPSP